MVRVGSRDVKGPPDAAHEFSAAETGSLIERGWQGPKSFNDGFPIMASGSAPWSASPRRWATRPGRGHAGQFRHAVRERHLRPRGVPGRARAQQSTAPEDTGLVAEIERLAADLAAAIGLAKPGAAPDDSWATVDLDVNDDLVVDQRDLQAARAETAATDGEAQP